MASNNFVSSCLNEEREKERKEMVEKEMSGCTLKRNGLKRCYICYVKETQLFFTFIFFSSKWCSNIM